MVSSIKTTNSLPQWQRFLSTLTPCLHPKPVYKSVDKSISFGPPSISRLFFTKINAKLFSNLGDHHANSLLKYCHKNRIIDLDISPNILYDSDTYSGIISQTLSFASIKHKHQNQSDNLSKSVSKWTLKMISKYIDLEDYVEELVIDTNGSDFSREMAGVTQETLNMFHTSYEKPALQDVLSTESDVRIFLTAVLRDLCPKLGISLRTEERIQLVHLPTCKFDFLFLTHDGKPIGCMEAKRASAMNHKAFTQAVLQLLLLQQMAWRNDVDISTVPLFNILSDGHRFVLMQVKGDTLCLEHASNGDDDVLKIRTSKVMEALFDLIKMTMNCKP